MMKESEASSVAALPKRNGRRKLLQCMGVELDLSYDESLRSEIHTNLLYDSFTHAVDKGFSWRDVCIAVHLIEKLLNSLIGKSMVEATSIYKETALTCGMDNRNLVVLTDYFFQTFMQHYRLYQYVFAFERDTSKFVANVTVEAPVPPDELRNAKTPSLHEYEQRLREIQSKRTDQKELQSIANVEVHLDEDLSGCPQTEALKKIISKVIKDVGKPLIDDITNTIGSTYGELDVKLEETALSRPKQLGPPPRYQIKPSLPMPKATIPAAKTVPPGKGSAKSGRGRSGKNK